MVNVTRDARKLDHKTLEEMRLRAVQRVQDGESPEVVCQVFGVSRAAIYNWLAMYRAGGACAARQTDSGPSAHTHRLAIALD